jgi:hypothetical protein
MPSPSHLLGRLTRTIRRRPGYTVPASIVVAGALVATLAGCAADATAPVAPASPSLVGTVTRTVTTTVTTVTGTVGNVVNTLVNGLLWTKPVTETTVTKVIGPAGGTLSIPNGIRLTVPPGAVASNTQFRITRLAGNVVAYEFEPHGTFALPLTIEQPTLGTNLFKLSEVNTISGAYFKDSSLINELLGTATVSEFAPTFVSADRAWVTFTVKHFSGWMVSSGR